MLGRIRDRRGGVGVVPHNPGCADKTKWKWVDKRWVTRERREGTFREQWATKRCKTCGGDLGDSMMKSSRVRASHKRKS